MASKQNKANANWKLKVTYPFLCSRASFSLLLFHTLCFTFTSDWQLSTLPKTSGLLWSPSGLKLCNVVVIIQSCFLLSLTLAQVYLKDSWSGRVLLAILGLRMHHNIQMDNPGTDSGRVAVLGLFYYFNFKWLPTDIKQTHVNILKFPYHNCWWILFFHTLPVLFCCHNYIHWVSNM